MEVKFINLSEKIELVLCVFGQCRSDALWFEEQLKNEERKENNIRHEMEGTGAEDGHPPKYERRAILATQWQDTLIARRVAKDNIAVNQPIVEFLDSDLGSNAINKLKQKLGEIRKIEKGLQNRIYFKRKINDSSDDLEKKQNLNKLINDWKKNNRSKY